MNKKLLSILHTVKKYKKEIFEFWIIDSISIILTTIVFIIFIHSLKGYINSYIIYKIKIFIFIWFLLTIFIGCILSLKSLFFINKQVKEMVKQDGTK